MSQFELVMTLVSFFVAFGVSKLLSGWKTQYLRKDSVKAYGLQIAYSLLALLAMLQNAWATWLWHEVTWTFTTFMLLLLSNISIVAAASLILPDDDNEKDLKLYYFRVQRPFFVFCGFWLFFGGIMEISLSSQTSSPIPLSIMLSIRAIAIAMFIYLTFVKKPSHHWVGFGAGALLQVGWIAAVSNDMSYV